MFDALNCSVVRSRRYLQLLPKLINRLMMERVHHHCWPVQLMQCAASFTCDAVATFRAVFSSFRVAVTFSPIQVRYEGATKKYVDDLKPAADTQNG